MPEIDPNGSRVFVIPLGGLGEVGKNATVLSTGEEMILIDAGLAFPGDELPGVDMVIPDFTFIYENADKLRAVVLTHGHEDHTGGLPFLLKQLNVPIWATPLTFGLVEEKLEEHALQLHPASGRFVPGQAVRIGSFVVHPIRVNHSIPDAVALAIETPAGIVIHTGDYKIDHTPVDGLRTDLYQFASFGERGVLALLGDSTNAERPGVTGSERLVGQTLDEIIEQAPGRVLVATFASNVHRLQQAIDAGHRHGRKTAVVGRSMEKTTEVAVRLGYLKPPEGALIGVEEMARYRADELVILTTGSQGEPMSALTRMSNAEHRLVEIVPGDTVVIAATPIPGNERLVSRTINNLLQRGAEVIYHSRPGVHVSGHASQEELKLMLALTRPKFLIPMHGEFRHLQRHAQLGVEMGIPSERIVLGENGSVIEITPDRAAVVSKVASGQVLVDGLGVGDVGNVVLRDRRQLSQDGILIVVAVISRRTGELLSGPDIISRGFVYVRESEELLEEARQLVREQMLSLTKKRYVDWATLKTAVRDALTRLLYERTRRRPVILPVIMES